MSGATVAESLHRAQARLAPLHNTARLDSELLLAHLLGRERTWIHTWPEHRLDEATRRHFEQLVEKRRQGWPVAYLTGHCGFWSLSLEVNPSTLIPRPETELLVEQALERIPADARWRIADLGTGSGAVAIAVARERPRCRIVATDRCATALATAGRNAVATGVSNIVFRSGDWYRPLRGERFHLILSNPPYVAENDPHLSRGDLRFEPPTALVAGSDGLDAIRTLIEDGRNHLEAGGWLLLEHGFDQGSTVTALLHRAGYRDIARYEDLAGHHRVSGGRQAV